MIKPLKTQVNKSVNLLIENQLRGALCLGEMTPTPPIVAKARPRKTTGGPPPHPIFYAGHSDPIQCFEAKHPQKKTRMFEVCEWGLGVCL